MKAWCPRCNQGWVTPSRVKKTGEIVSVCEECEALGPDSVPISFETFIDMSDFLVSKGLSGQWSDLVDVE